MTTDITANGDLNLYRANLEFEAHVKRNFIEGLQPLIGKHLYCTVAPDLSGSGHEQGAMWPEILKQDGLCGEPAAIVLAWKQSDDDQGRVVIRCLEHLTALTVLGDFSPNDFLLPYCFSTSLGEDGVLTQQLVDEIG